MAKPQGCMSLLRLLPSTSSCGIAVRLLRPRSFAIAGARVATVQFGSVSQKTVPLHGGFGSHRFTKNDQKWSKMKHVQKRLPRTSTSGGYFLNTKKQPENTKNENRPKLHLKRRFKSSRYWHRIPDEKLHLKPSSKHVLMPFTQNMSFWRPMSTPKTVHNGSGSQRIRFKRF